MKHLSKVASMICVGAVSLAIVGCGSSHSTSEGEGACPIPASVKAPLDMNQTTAKQSITLSGGAEWVGSIMSYIILDRVGYGPLNQNQKPSSANVDDNTKAMAKHLAKKVVALLAKAKNPQNKILGEDEDEFFGDDLACDEGTYSLQHNHLLLHHYLCY